MTITTRFAPSPTGALHIGSARTALFNYLFARRHNGKYLLRVEDTDVARSTDAAKQIILDSLEWLGLKNDDEIVYQLARSNRHAEVAHELVKKGKAYYCYTPQEEINKLREEAQSKGESFLFRSPWRDGGTPPEGQKPVVRIKAPRDGATEVNDLVQGKVVVQNAILDDMVILRSDGTPTYMLAVVVDDHDMNVSHVIRGDDHLNNTFRQIMIYDAMEWKRPEFAHIPLIHGSDGAKLSKRHGALSVLEYREMGILPESLLNYLLRLGWSHGNEEIIPIEKAIEWFNLEHVNKGAAKFDMAKLLNLNAHYIKESSNERLISLIENLAGKFSDSVNDKIIKGLDSLKIRAKTINELQDQAKFYYLETLDYSDEIKSKMTDEKKDLLKNIMQILENVENWQQDSIKSVVEDFLNSKQLKLGQFGEVVRYAVTNSTSSPSMFEVLEIVGKEMSQARIKSFLEQIG